MQPHKPLIRLMRSHMDFQKTKGGPKAITMRPRWLMRPHEPLSLVVAYEFSKNQGGRGGKNYNHATA